jgi:hypothetical protein
MIVFVSSRTQLRTQLSAYGRHDWGISCRIAQNLALLTMEPGWCANFSRSVELYREGFYCIRCRPRG